MTAIRKIGVVGAGQMGSGIAQTGAQAGYEVLLSDVSAEIASRAKEKISQQLDRLIEKGKLTEVERQGVLGRIQPVGGPGPLAECDLVIEAITENREIKFETFRELDDLCKATTILASNTSSISLTEIAAATKRPDRVAGMHFMNPVPVMKLVEGIRALQTSDETFFVVRAVAEKMGKIFIEANDLPGFAVNRILMPMINEAVYALHEGVASVSDIDQAMKLGTNQPMGPLELADFIGLDTCLAIMNVLHRGLGDSKYRACPLLRKYVSAGWLGRKAGRGFHSYGK
ncbi:MAG: 3-hydroxybutyryl-CoA dehydrogenase [Bdellovibrionales bacterium]|nr:3-hydroxybutyryl-CoA dehydrogenase [Bdellovibrionales bacterium]